MLEMEGREESSKVSASMFRLRANIPFECHFYCPRVRLQDSFFTLPLPLSLPLCLSVYVILINSSIYVNFFLKMLLSPKYLSRIGKVSFFGQIQLFFMTMEIKLGHRRMLTKDTNHPNKQTDTRRSKDEMKLTANDTRLYTACIPLSLVVFIC